jgi:hypothetical protein
VKTWLYPKIDLASMTDLNDKNLTNKRHRQATEYPWIASHADFSEQSSCGAWQRIFKGTCAASADERETRSGFREAHAVPLNHLVVIGFT